MSFFDNAKAMVKHAHMHLSEIKAAYESSLDDKEIKPHLLIEIKNFMENLRSALDFVANGLFAKYGSSKKKSPNIYFPYAFMNQSETDFKKSNRIEICIPGLVSRRSDIAKKIISYQHFTDEKNKWLPIFMELNNENKHQRLTPQTRKETKELRISSGRTSITVGQNASISIGKGATIQIGETVIPGGQEFNVEKPPYTIGQAKKEVITWVSFHFSTIDTPVFPLLNYALEGVALIVSDLSSI